MDIKYIKFALMVQGGFRWGVIIKSLILSPPTKTSPNVKSNIQIPYLHTGGDVFNSKILSTYI